MSTTLPTTRQVVLLTSDLEKALDQAREAFGVPQGFRAVEEMEGLGFKHEIFGFDRTYVEICEPLDAASSAGRSIARHGDGGFMLTVQVASVEQMIKRGADLGITPLFTVDHHGNTLTQWHPRDLGTLAEIDELADPDSWHFTPDVYEARNADIVADIVGAVLSVPDPEAMASRWAALLAIDVAEDGTSVDTSPITLRFVDEPERRGLVRVEARAADHSRRGEAVTLCGLDFLLT